MIAGASESAGYSHPLSVSPSIVLKLTSLRLFTIFETGRARGVLESLDKDFHTPQSGRFVAGVFCATYSKGYNGLYRASHKVGSKSLVWVQAAPSLGVAERRGCGGIS